MDMLFSKRKGKKLDDGKNSTIIKRKLQNVGRHFATFVAVTEPSNGGEEGKRERQSYMCS
jgi:hypothetical protein